MRYLKLIIYIVWLFIKGIVLFLATVYLAIFSHLWFWTRSLRRKTANYGFIDSFLWVGEWIFYYMRRPVLWVWAKDGRKTKPTEN
jgi:hypothetical protein